MTVRATVLPVSRAVVRVIPAQGERVSRCYPCLPLLFESASVFRVSQLLVSESVSLCYVSQPASQAVIQVSPCWITEADLDNRGSLCYPSRPLPSESYHREIPFRRLFRVAWRLAHESCPIRFRVDYESFPGRYREIFE